MAYKRYRKWQLKSELADAEFRRQMADERENNLALSRPIPFIEGHAQRRLAFDEIIVDCWDNGSWITVAAKMGSARARAIEDAWAARTDDMEIAQEAVHRGIIGGERL